ncbi:Type I restriction-modification system, specificity subunit S [uncultured Gammaproteobacteria bacterium]|nr:Type I restriction-modification system, specificity subunit S [uncultured Gammaproteobacteria bacterium]CAC9957723.1 Type I restriction-modification system, specificity subunit S [uncultured Gammaproteobacteria bacterium]
MKMDKNLHIPQGYRQTEVGVIPDDWRIVKIGDVFDFIKTYSNSRNDLSDIGEIEYLHYGDIHTKYKYHLDFDKNVLPKISFEKFKTNIEYVKNGDLFIADASENYADIGKSVETVNLYNKKVVSGLHTFLLRDKGNNFSNKYKGLILYNQNVSKTIKKIATGVSVLGISKTNLNKLKIPLPPKQEQQKIADILTTWDNAINQQTTLIEKKQQLKKGLMQQLLTAKTRFSEFSDDWEIAKLGDIGEFKTSSVNKKIVKGEKLVQLVNYMNVYKHENISNSSIKNLMTVSANKTQLDSSNLRKNDMLFTPSSETPDDIGHSIVIFEDLENTLYSYHLTRFRPKLKLNIIYSHYFCNTHYILKQISKVATGSTRFTISINDFSQILVKLPSSTKEQQKIAQVLTLADDEITKLQTELALLKTQKKGLMQQLLTGKIRIKIQENEMGRKVFVSYKHGDNSVKNLIGYYNNTVRDYVDYLMDKTLKDDVYKGEGNEDLSEFKDNTIRDRLKNKIHDSSVTLVLISPNMKDSSKNESDQWIPWEISYSLKEIIRKDKTSHTNGILAVILPDYNGFYSYFIQDDTCKCCNSETIKTDTLFRILDKNMFNAKVLNPSNCPYCESYEDDERSSYIEQVKWCDFISDKDYYLNRAVSIRDDRKSYNITKEV